ncbi:MAG: tetratricopeptide repeat protein [Candidatus Hydrothermales bacterium]
MRTFIFLITLSQSPEERADIYVKLADYKNAVIEYSDLLHKKPDDKKIIEKLMLSASKYVDIRSIKIEYQNFEKALQKYVTGELDSALIISKELFKEYYFHPKISNFYQQCVWTVDTLRRLHSQLLEADKTKDYLKAHRISIEMKNVYPFYPGIDEKINNYFAKIPKVEEKRPVTEKREIVRRVVEKEVEVEKPSKVEETVDIQAKVQDLYKRGVTLYSEGKLEAARDVFREILRIDPQNTKVRRNLAVIEERLRGRR